MSRHPRRLGRKYYDPGATPIDHRPDKGRDVKPPAPPETETRQQRRARERAERKQHPTTTQ